MGLLVRMRQRVGCVGRVLGGLLLIALLLSAFMRDLAQFPRSASWPAVEGEVLTSGYDDGDLDFRYRYRVEGTAYESKRITFFQYALFANRVQQEQFVAQHPAGSALEVHYDPADPVQSVVMRSIPLSQIWSPLLFAMCLTIVLATGVAGWLLRRLAANNCGLLAGWR